MIVPSCGIEVRLYPIAADGRPIIKESESLVCVYEDDRDPSRVVEILVGRFDAPVVAYREVCRSLAAREGALVATLAIRLASQERPIVWVAIARIADFVLCAVFVVVVVVVESPSHALRTECKGMDAVICPNPS